MNIDELRKRMRDRMPNATSRAQSKAKGYSIQNAAANEAVIRIYDEIWFLGVNAEDFAADLDEITASNIRVEINSPGGDVFDAVAIYNALRTHPAHITTRVDGLAASAASLIVQAGDHRVMLGGSQMMVHNAWGIAIGNADDHRDMATLLDQQDDVIAGIYASRSGGDKAAFRALMGDETWLTDEQTVEKGLADEVVEPERQQQPGNRRTGPPLHDQISEAVAAVSAAVESAERVGALRAEAGKTLSQRVQDSLGELAETTQRLQGLLDAEPQNKDEGGEDASDELYREMARFVAITQGVN